MGWERVPYESHYGLTAYSLNGAPVVCWTNSAMRVYGRTHSNSGPPWTQAMLVGFLHMDTSHVSEILAHLCCQCLYSWTVLEGSTGQGRVWLGW